MTRTISKRLATVALATAGSVAAFGFAGTAQAASLAGTLAITGTANVSPWQTTNPLLEALDVTAVNGGTGQFQDASMADAPADIQLIGNPGTTNPFIFVAPQNVYGFVKVVVSAAHPVAHGMVIGSITSAAAVGIFSGDTNNNTTSYVVSGGMTFDEPGSLPDLLGTYSISFTRSVTAGQVSQSYALSLQKTDSPVVDVPEPSAILGVLAVAGASAFARRKS